LETPVWHKKRRLVFRRCHEICEGCGERQAEQVHHLRYPNAFPGSDDWIEKEMLFDLKGICDRCHENIHDR
jgi:hypothetical protein